MKTVKVQTYQFNELSPEAQEKALNWYRESQQYDSYRWFDDMKEDAKESASFKIESLNDNPISGEGSFISSARETAEAILENHGEVCDTYQTAKTFLDAHIKLCDTLRECEEQIDLLNERNEDEWTTGDKESYRQNEQRIDELESEIEDLEQEFESDIAHAYGVLWSKEIEYQSSDEAIRENIEANEYEFLEDGTRFPVRSSYAVEV